MLWQKDLHILKCLLMLKMHVVRVCQVLKELFDSVYFYRDGGSIPALALFKEHLGLYMTCFSFGLPDDSIHAPNERYVLRLPLLLWLC